MDGDHLLKVSQERKGRSVRACASLSVRSENTHATQGCVLTLHRFGPMRDSSRVHGIANVVIQSIQKSDQAFTLEFGREWCLTIHVLKSRALSSDFQASWSSSDALALYSSSLSMKVMNGW